MPEHHRVTLEDIAHGFKRLEDRFGTLETRFDSLETRFDSLETRFSHLHNFVGERWAEMNTGIVGLRRDVDSLYQRVGDLEHRMMWRFDAVDERFDAVDGRFDVVEQRLASLEAR